MKRTRPHQNILHEISDALAEITPILRIEECALTLSRFEQESGTAFLEAKGGCPDCGISVATFLEGIETQVRRSVPEVKRVQIISAGTAQ